MATNSFIGTGTAISGDASLSRNCFAIKTNFSVASRVITSFTASADRCLLALIESNALSPSMLMSTLDAISGALEANS